MNPQTEPRSPRWLARVVFLSFLLTFVAARVLVYLIMARRLPDLYLRLGGTHVHHLNHGIFLLSAIGGYLLFKRPQGRALTIVGAAYGAALALTFDEFGMWLHLGGSYWQRASFDAVIVIAAFLGLLAFAPSWRAVRAVHGWSLAGAALAVAVFFYCWTFSFRFVERRIAPHLHTIENSGPP